MLRTLSVSPYRLKGRRSVYDYSEYFYLLIHFFNLIINQYTVLLQIQIQE